MNEYDLVGYSGLVLNLFSMYTKGEFRLRIYSAIANIVYVAYGLLISAMPIVIGCSIAVFLHLYRLKGLKTINNVDYSKGDKI